MANVFRQGPRESSNFFPLLRSPLPRTISSLSRRGIDGSRVTRNGNRIITSVHPAFRYYSADGRLIRGFHVNRRVAACLVPIVVATS